MIPKSILLIEKTIVIKDNQSFIFPDYLLVMH